MHIFNIGLFIALLSAAFQFGVVVVAGRAAALCYRLVYHRPRRPGGERCRAVSLDDFRRYCRTCERMYLIGMAFFFASIIFLVFFMFTHTAYSVAYLCISVTGGILLYRTGFLQISVTLEALKDFAICFTRLQKRGNDSNATV